MLRTIYFPYAAATNPDGQSLSWLTTERLDAALEDFFKQPSWLSCEVTFVFVAGADPTVSNSRELKQLMSEYVIEKLIQKGFVLQTEGFGRVTTKIFSQNQQLVRILIGSENAWGTCPETVAMLRIAAPYLHNTRPVVAITKCNHVRLRVIWALFAGQFPKLVGYHTKRDFIYYMMEAGKIVYAALYAIAYHLGIVSFPQGLRTIKSTNA